MKVPWFFFGKFHKFILGIPRNSLSFFLNLLKCRGNFGGKFCRDKLVFSWTYPSLGTNLLIFSGSVKRIFFEMSKKACSCFNMAFLFHRLLLLVLDCGVTMTTWCRLEKWTAGLQVSASWSTALLKPRDAKNNTYYVSHWCFRWKTWDTLSLTKSKKAKKKKSASF